MTQTWQDRLHTWLVGIPWRYRMWRHRRRDARRARTIPRHRQDPHRPRRTP